MNIQSLSIAVPAGCPNKCKFCVSQMHEAAYPNILKDVNLYQHIPGYLTTDTRVQDFSDRLAFARDNGCNTLMFTGNGEALMNKSFVDLIAELNHKLTKPFRNLELQTSGILLTPETLKWLRRVIKVSTISLSLSCIWDSIRNKECCNIPDLLSFNIDDLCAAIKEEGFNLRLSLNMSDEQYIEGQIKDPLFNIAGLPNVDYTYIDQLFARASNLGTDQLTFRKLYSSGDSPQSRWVEEHSINPKFWERISSYIIEKGTALERLPYGARRYSVKDISVVVDDDSMSYESKDEIKYLVLRPNGKLYTRWDTKGSLLF